MVEVVPLTAAAGYVYIEKVRGHGARYSKTVFAVGCAEDGRIIGAAVTGLPTWLPGNGWTLAVQLSPGVTPESRAALLEAVWAAAQALGYTRLLEAGGVLYVLPGHDPLKPLPMVEMTKRKRKTRWESALGGYRHGK